MPMSGLHFVIIEKDHLIAADMEAGLRGALPNCHVSRVVLPADAAQLPPEPELRTIFITSDRLDVIDASGLSAVARTGKSRIVVRAGFDPDAEVLARGYEMLATPFTDADLQEIASRLMTV